MSGIEGRIIGDLMASIERTNARLVLFTPSGVITGSPVRGTGAAEQQTPMELLARLIQGNYEQRRDEFLVLRDVTVQNGQTVHSAEILVVFLSSVTGVTLGG